MFFRCKNTLIWGAIGLFCLLGPAGSTALGATAAQGQTSKQTGLPDFVPLAEKLEPVVVNISTTQGAPKSPARGQPSPSPDPFGGQDPFGGNDPARVVLPPESISSAAGFTKLACRSMAPFC